MATQKSTAGHEATFERVREVRAKAIEHTRLAREFSGQRRDLILGLIDQGLSQADVARELGVTRQAVQKWLTL
jgi:DNA invertase Pin-like site-specific DNA recombinase